ncbi:FecCD family ABC transporter permease [Actinomadura hibisca]|uniref:FecCD family ABC transporter permease n=1 Tax=Actinomadura hibisca TaxID=68565 RepID=UPI000830CB56|nr:iron ABC transporter permease [Actinomadura hibisca]
MTVLDHAAKTSPTETAALLRRRRHAAARRTAALVTLLAALLVGLLAVALTVDLKRVPLSEVAPAALGLRDGLADYVIFKIRMPRALTAVLAGALFGLSGVLYQRLIRNPLATPDIIGVSAGAGAGALTMLVLLPALPHGMTLAALAGAFAAVGVIHTLSRRRGTVDTYRVVLVGIGLSALFTSYHTYLFTLADDQDQATAMRWFVGSAAGADWTSVTILAWSLGACALGAVLLERPLSGLTLGDEMATGLGARVPLARTATLLLGAAAAALATSVVGPIAFVALISGPIAARLAGADRAGWLAAPVGAVLVLASDVIAQHAPVISPVPTGACTALIGAPYFVWLILRRTTGDPT